MKKLFFVKMSGAGNDFIVLDKGLNPDLVFTASDIKQICDRRKGIGGDGLITIGDSNAYDFLMEYYNADGSTGSLCGNGARCAIKFAESSKRLKGKETKFLSNGVEYSGEVLNDGLIKVYFRQPENLKLNFKVKAGGQLITSHFVNSGSPHVVIDVKEILQKPSNPKSNFSDINDVPVFQIGKEIRNLPEFSPGGTNVNFFSLTDDDIYIRTYERGVEDETLACGTGNVATAIILNKLKGIKAPIKLITRGGDKLIVDYNSDEQQIKDLTLTGPVKVVFTGEFLFNNTQN
jgi:diaminopimelate epimerase